MTYAGRALCLAALLAGCGVSLRDRPVTALEVEAVGVSSVCPGGRVPLAVIATVAEGERLATQGAGDGDVRWDDYQVRVRGGTLDDGVIRVAPDARATWASQAVEVEVESRHHPGLEPARIRVPVSHGCDFRYALAGERGSQGAMGAMGNAGLSGRRSFRDPGTGTRGGDGGDGSPGWPGDDGAAGPRIEVAVTLVAGADPPLLAVTVRPAGHQPRLYVVDPQRGSMTIAARGGDGGDGGDGGQGGDGGLGQPSGSGGQGGRGGDGGDGGRGGVITVTMSPGAAAFASALRHDVRGGDGGRGGRGGSCGSPCRFSGTPGSSGREGPRGPTPATRVLDEPPGAILLESPDPPVQGAPSTSGGLAEPLGDPG